MLTFTRNRTASGARLHQIATGVSALYWGCGPGSYEGDDPEGSYLYDNGQGDRFVVGWDASRAVGLVFGHESGRSRYRTEGWAEAELKDEAIFTGLIGDTPWSAALPLTRKASVALQEVATAALLVTPEGSWLSDPLTPRSPFANGLEMLVGFGVPAEVALLGPGIFQPWAEGQSLDETQAELCLRWHERSAHGPFGVTEDERELLRASGTIDAAAVPMASEALAAVGIHLGQL